MILVCFAIEREARPFIRLAAGCHEAKTAVSGMGRAAAEKTIAALFAAHTPDLVLTCGYAGGLNPALRTGQVLYSTDPGFPLTDRLEHAGARASTFFCSPTVLATAALKAAARKQTGADAVEMESEWIRAFCRSKGVPSATVRVVLDEAAADLPFDFNSVMDRDQKILFTKLAGAILRNPPLAATLGRMGRDSKRCAEALAAVLWNTVRPV